MAESHHPFESEEIHEPINEIWAQKRRLSQAIKRLTENFVTSAPDAELLSGLADKVEDAADQLENTKRYFGRVAFSDTEEHGSYGFISHEINPLIGLANPIAPPINMWIDGETVRGTVTLGWAYEGPPSCVHGGFVVAVFDQFLGFTQVLTKQPGVTGTLTTRFEKPTPLNTQLRLEARVQKVEGRKIFIEGEMYAGETRTASCKGLFLSIPPETFRTLGEQT
ncbi:MAG: PaaI family thioesterase [Deltaproteobacteria bacterium]|nr:PaaI family thioesterase [Deltaproteobacteria bacterium]